MPAAQLPALESAVHRTPVGALTVVVDPLAAGDRGEQPYGAVILGTFRPLEDEDRLPSGRRVRLRAAAPEITEVLTRYADGDLDALEEVSVQQPGSVFQQQVWASMRTIRGGSVETYGRLARRAGHARAARAAGTACAINLVAPFVPCHRVVASTGVGGYGYGVDLKVRLLAHEGVWL